MKQELHINGKYQHKKGNMYLVKGIVSQDNLTNDNKNRLRFKGTAMHSETKDLYSIYQLEEGKYVAINVITGETITRKCILYKALYETKSSGLWIRDYDMFMDGRFKFVGIS